MPPHFITDYRGADIELERRVRAFLEHRGIASLDHVRLAVRGGAVILRGNVESRREALSLADYCRRVAGVLKVIDILHVESPLAAEEAEPASSRAFQRA